MRGHGLCKRQQPPSGRASFVFGSLGSLVFRPFRPFQEERPPRAPIRGRLAACKLFPLLYMALPVSDSVDEAVNDFIDRRLYAIGMGGGGLIPLRGGRGLPELLLPA